MAWKIRLAVEAGVNSCKIFSLISVVAVGSRIPAHKFRKLLQLTRYSLLGLPFIYLSDVPAQVHLVLGISSDFCLSDCYLSTPLLRSLLLPVWGRKDTFCMWYLFLPNRNGNCRGLLLCSSYDAAADYKLLKDQSNQPTWLDITFSTWYKKTGYLKSNAKSNYVNVLWVNLR